MQSVKIADNEAGQRLDKYLAKYMCAAPKSFLYKMLRKKNITLNGKKATGTEKLEAGDEVRLFLAEETIAKFQEEVKQEVEHGMEKKNDIGILPSYEEAQSVLDIVYEDDEVLVISKPTDMLSQKANKEDISLVEYIETYVMKNSKEETTFKPGICNRLDRNTTGLIVAGKTIRSLQYLNRLFKERDLEKYYLCIVKGKLKEESHIDGYLKKDTKHNRVRIMKEEVDGAVRIITAYQPLQTIFWQEEWYTLLKVHLITGKSHQIRAHLQSIGHPIVGDAKYGEKSLYHKFKKEFGVKHQLLHAWQLYFASPAYLPQKYHGKKLEAPIPKEFKHVLLGIGMVIPEQ